MPIQILHHDMEFKKHDWRAFLRLFCSLRIDAAAIAIVLIFSVGQIVAQETEAELAPQIAAEIPPVQTGFETNQTEMVVGPANPGQSAPALAGTSQLYSGSPQPSMAGTSPLRWGKLSISPHLLYQLSYGNGVQSSPTQLGNTLVNQVSPGILVALGTHWSIDYTPTMRFYSDNRFQDGTDHSVSLNGSAEYQDWRFGVLQGYSSSSQPLVETAAQTHQEAYSTALTANYQFNSKMSLSLSANQNFRYVDEQVASENLTNMREWSTLEWLNYQLAPPLEVGLGAGFTYDNLTAGPDMTSEQLQGRVSWRPGNKLRFSLTGGLNDQQYLRSSAPDLLSPIFSISAQYQLFTATSLSLAANRIVTPSYFQATSSEVTGVNGGIRQRLLQKLFLDASGGYSSTRYHSATTGPISGNIGDYTSTSFSVSLSTVFFKKATASVFYQVSYNSSGSAIYNYTTTQGGLSLGYHF